jgi:hypothetical protein
MLSYVIWYPIEKKVVTKAIADTVPTLDWWRKKWYEHSYPEVEIVFRAKFSLAHAHIPVTQGLRCQIPSSEAHDRSLRAFIEPRVFQGKWVGIAPIAEKVEVKAISSPEG